jgi:nicotinamide-nucleotide amidase
MKVEIITIGDEILIGQIVDTNSAWMAARLHDIGCEVFQVTSIGDEPEQILKTFEEAGARADIVLITGGLGPTKDDLTKDLLCTFFRDTLVFNEDVFGDVKRIFDERGIVMPAINRKQAEVPSRCDVIRNPNGTAPGMWFETHNVIYVSMPGVPYEMKGMMEKFVLPRLKERYTRQERVYRTVLTQGIGESSLLEHLSVWEDSLAAKGLRLAWLPSAGKVRLRISAKGEDRIALLRSIDAEVEEVRRLIPTYFIGVDQDKLEVLLGELLKEKGWRLSVAESCSGGYIAHLLTSVAGSSDYFEGGVVCYSNDLKIQLLGVKETTLRQHGAVSEQVAKEMAEGAVEAMHTQCAIAVTGIAGPTGGSPDKPVGTVCICIRTPQGIKVQKYVFGKSRERNIQQSATTAMGMLYREILSY